MANGKKRKKTYYKDEEAARMGLGPTATQHGYSRNPETGLLFKKPGHPTLNKSVSSDQRQGYRTYQRGTGMASYPTRDPRAGMSSMAAMRDPDISGAVYDAETLDAIASGKAKRTAALRKKRLR